MAGKWEITWVGFDEIRTGTLLLNSDHTLLLPGSEQVDIMWEEGFDALNVTRVDNNFLLRYHILNRSERTINLYYTEEIQVYLNR